jgi:hypothetical protein
MGNLAKFFDSMGWAGATIHLLPDFTGFDFIQSLKSTRNILN